MNETVFSEEERVELLNIFETAMADQGVEKEDLSNAQRALYMKLGGDPSGILKGGLDGNM